MKTLKIALGTFLLSQTLTYAAVVSVSLGSGSYDLYNNGGAQLLTDGGAGNGNGALVSLGFYTDATVAASFGTSDSNFVALTGLGNIFGSGLTSVGDLATNGAGPGNFFIDGLTINNTNPNAASLPAVGTPLVVRVYNAPTVAASNFRMEFSNPNLWLWKAPGVPAPSITIDLDDANLRLLTNQITRASAPLSGGGPVSANIALAAIPEPSTISFGVVSVLTLLGSRRRRREVVASR